MPMSTSVSGSTLSTRSLLGKKSVDLTTVSRIRGSVIIPGVDGSAAVKGLKLTDNTNSVYVQLGSIPASQRRGLWNAVRPCVERARHNKAMSQDFTFEIKFSRNTDRTWWTFQRWEPK